MNIQGCVFLEPNRPPSGGDSRKIVRMRIRYWTGLAIAVSTLTTSGSAASFASRVAAYDPGALPASMAAYTNTTAALGEPSRVTPGAWGGPVDPFSPPYTTDQLLAVGTNGSLTVEFAAPILHDPRHPFGLDFILFAGGGFVITNGDYTGGGITDGSAFGFNAGHPRISVSADGAQFYPLDPAMTDTLSPPWPTDGEGSFSRPLDPAMTDAACAGKNLAALRRAYNGAAGGLGFDLAWARDAQGKPAGLRAARFLRIENPDGLLKIDGFSAVESSGDFLESFAQDPAASGWDVVGDPGLFHWDATRQTLGVTWDSSRGNSYFYRPLGARLNRQDDFGVAFDITMDSIAAGQTPGKDFTFELAVGFINRADAFGTNFVRGKGTGKASPNLVEFDYFPDTGFGATVSTAVTSDSQFLTANTFPLELTTGNLFHVVLQYTAANQTLRTVMTKDGAPFGPIKDLVLGTNFTDFSVDAFAVSSYSDQAAGGSILAVGVVDNIAISMSPAAPPQLTAQALADRYETTFPATANWFYALERSVNLTDWTEVASQTAPTNGWLTLGESPKPAGQASYRVRTVRR